MKRFTDASENVICYRRFGLALLLAQYDMLSAIYKLANVPNTYFQLLRNYCTSRYTGF